MNAPSFLRRRETAVETDPPRDIDAETAGIMETIVQTRRERDAFKAELSNVDVANKELRREVDFLRGQLHEVERKRDFYQRHYVALFTQLATVGMTVNAALDDAKAQAAAQGIQQERQARGLDDDGAAELAQKLAPESRTDA